jgi:hypothetical protein
MKPSNLGGLIENVSSLNVKGYFFEIAFDCSAVTPLDIKAERKLLISTGTTKGSRSLL